MGIDVVVKRMGEDWVMIHPVLSEFRKEVELERLPGLLQKTMIEWLEERPQASVRSSLAIVEGGSTIAIHLWVDIKRAGG